MDRSEAVVCLNSLNRYILPRNHRLNRSFNNRFRDAGSQSAKVVVRKVKYILSGMTLREIVQAYKKSCFPSLRLRAIVFEELCRRRVDSNGVMSVVFNACSKAHGEYPFIF